MPYITQYRRDAIAAGDSPFTPGELNYVLTLACIAYVRRMGGFNYRVASDVVSALDNAKAEFRRRLLDHYEDIKADENGDVYLPLIIELYPPDLIEFRVPSDRDSEEQATLAVENPDVSSEFREV